MAATAASQTASAGRPGWAWWVLCVLATAVGGYGLLLQDARAAKAAVPGLPWLDAVHFVGGGLALVVGVWGFRRDVLARARQWHRRLGQIYCFAVLSSGLAGLAMAVYSTGGLPTHLGFGLLAVLWLATTGIGWRHIHHREVVPHRRWMVRSYALACAAISLRVELPLLVFATGSFGLAYQIVSWACWVPNLLFAEWWLARTDHAGRWRS